MYFWKRSTCLMDFGRFSNVIKFPKPSSLQGAAKELKFNLVLLYVSTIEDIPKLATERSMKKLESLSPSSPQSEKHKLVLSSCQLLRPRLSLLLRSSLTGLVFRWR